VKRKFKHIATIAAGVILAVAIICSNVWTNHFTKATEATKTEQGADTKSDTSFEFFSVPTLSPPSVFHVHLSLDSFCLFDRGYESMEEDSEVSDPIEPPKLLLTLFRVIISPNAP
jgi:hypothetical protein